MASLRAFTNGRADAVAGEGEEAHRQRHHGEGHRLVAPAAPVEAAHEAEAAGDHPLAVEEAIEIGGQIGGGGVALVGLLVQALAGDDVEGLGTPGALIRSGDGLLDQHLEEDVARLVLHEGRLAGEEVVEGRAQAVDVAAGVDAARVPTRLLRRHVARGPHDRARLGEALPLGGLAGQAEVHEHGAERA